MMAHPILIRLDIQCPREGKWECINQSKDVQKFTWRLSCHRASRHFLLIRTSEMERQWERSWSSTVPCVAGTGVRNQCKRNRISIHCSSLPDPTTSVAWLLGRQMWKAEQLGRTMVYGNNTMEGGTLFPQSRLCPMDTLTLEVTATLASSHFFGKATCVERTKANRGQ